MLVGGANPLINLVVSVVRFSLSFFFFFLYLLVFTGDCLFRIRFSLLLAL